MAARCCRHGIITGIAVGAQDWAIGPKDLERVVVDTTVQPKAVAHPTDARLMHRAIIKLVELAKRNHVPLRQSYLRLAKRAAIMVGRYTHAHQFKRARRQLKFLRTRLGRIIRDIRRKIDGDVVLEARFGPLLGFPSFLRIVWRRYMRHQTTSAAKENTQGRHYTLKSLFRVAQPLDQTHTSSRKIAKTTPQLRKLG